MEVGEREEEEVKPLLFHRALSLRPANVCIRFVSYLSYREKSYFPVKNGERGGRVSSTNSRSPNHRHTVNTSCVYTSRTSDNKNSTSAMRRYAFASHRACFRHTTLSHIRVYTYFIKLIRDVSGKIPISRN